MFSRREVRGSIPVDYQVIFMLWLPYSCLMRFMSTRLTYPCIFVTHHTCQTLQNQRMSEKGHLILYPLLCIFPISLIKPPYTDPLIPWRNSEITLDSLFPHPASSLIIFPSSNLLGGLPSANPVSPLLIQSAPGKLPTFFPGPSHHQLSFTLQQQTPNLQCFPFSKLNPRSS